MWGESHPNVFVDVVRQELERCQHDATEIEQGDCMVEDGAAHVTGVPKMIKYIMINKTKIFFF